MDFLRRLEAELDAKSKFRTITMLAYDGVLTVKAAGLAQHSTVDSRNRDAECKEL
jgi:hypothetical protein